MRQQTVPCLALLAAAMLVATPAAAAVPRDAPTAPACLADTPLVPFAGHTLPLSTAPDPQSMTLERAFPLLPPFASPVAVTAAGDGTRRLFVAERTGRILVFRADTEATGARTFLDLRTRVESGGADEGVLGIAFDPAYILNGLFYVHYVSPAAQCDGLRTCTRLEQYRVSADPDVADPASRSVLLEVSQPVRLHQGGPIAFGPDGMLYVALGDGDASGNPLGTGQDLGSLLGKVLRIDPHGAFPYAVPPDNPFASNVFGWRPEIWAYGLRQPAGLAFDPATGWLWLGDRGQSAREEIDVLAGGGANLGWNWCEGSLDVAGRRCRDLVSLPPVLEYPHNGTGGFVVTGGRVYRGDRLPTLFGAYVYSDFSTGLMWAFDGARSVQIAGMNQVTAFAEAPDGELLVVRGSDGRIHRFRDAPFGASSGLPPLLSSTALFADMAAAAPAPGLVPYDVNVSQASEGARVRRWLALPAGAQLHVEPNGGLTYPTGAVLMQHFDFPGASGARPAETRLLLRQEARWLAASYRWNAAGTDAELVTQSSDGTVAIGGGASRSWHFPGPSECTGCHARSVGTLLGAKPAQLHLAWRCAGGQESQLAAWQQLGLLDATLAPPAPRDTLVDPENADARLSRRARSLLEVRCASCHQPAGRAPGDMDLRIRTGLASMRVVGVPVTSGSRGLPNPVRLAPGDRTRSMVWHRAQTTVRLDAMPPQRIAVDPVEVAVLGAWIDADPTRDMDGDGIAADDDVCPDAFDPAQGDADRDFVGDACDAICANGLDDDGDGLVDLGADPGCQNAAMWARENPACSNGVDDDVDGAADWPRDKTCVAPWQDDEGTAVVQLGCGLLGIEGAAAAWALLAIARRRAQRARASAPGSSRRGS
jgi:glucose/arabinose dehydrogenase